MLLAMDFRETVCGQRKPHAPVSSELYNLKRRYMAQPLSSPSLAARRLTEAHTLVELDPTGGGRIEAAWRVLAAWFCGPVEGERKEHAALPESLQGVLLETLIGPGASLLLLPSICVGPDEVTSLPPALARPLRPPAQ